MPLTEEERLAKEQRKASHGWFTTAYRAGDRTLAQQLAGLDPLFADIAGKSVLDVGCAEGLIAIECATRGATLVRGVEIVAEHAHIACRLRDGLPCYFIIADANEYAPAEAYDVVLLLALLHKLRDPSAACRRLAGAARSLCVIRFPTRSVGAVIVDERSNSVLHDIGAVMTDLGFALERIEAGPLDEATYYFRR